MLLLPLALLLGGMPTITMPTITMGILVAAAGSPFDRQLVSHRQEGTTLADPGPELHCGSVSQRVEAGRLDEEGSGPGNRSI